MSDRNPVGLQCGATGIDLGIGNLGLYVCAQDNDLSFDTIAPLVPPWEGSPLPTDEEVAAFKLGYHAGSRSVSL